MIDNGEHANGDLITPTVSLSASITPKMHYYDKNGEEKVYAGTPIDYQATIHTNAFQNAAKAKTWAVQNEAEKRTVNGDEVTFTYQVRTGALGTQGEILRQNSDYVDKGVLWIFPAIRSRKRFSRLRERMARRSIRSRPQ
ncbi:MAG: hypothetical protein ACLS6G_01685 [Christensenellales bacterium]